MRFHEGDGRPNPCYRRSTLRAWAARIAQQRQRLDAVYAFFNNDTRCCAPHDAAVFANECRALGLDVSRTPGAGDVKPG